MYIRQLNQSNLLLTPAYVHKLPFTETDTGRVLKKKGVLEKFANFTKTHVLESLRPAVLSKKDSSTGGFL